MQVLTRCSQQLLARAQHTRFCVLHIACRIVLRSNIYIYYLSRTQCMDRDVRVRTYVCVCAYVVGRDWTFGWQDGGEGSQGRVVSIDESETRPPLAWVDWSSASKNVYPVQLMDTLTVVKTLPQQLSEVSSLSVGKLKDGIRALGGSFVGCTEKSELQAKLRECLSAKLKQQAPTVTRFGPAPLSAGDWPFALPSGGPGLPRGHSGGSGGGVGSATAVTGAAAGVGEAWHCPRCDLDVDPPEEDTRLGDARLGERVSVCECVSVCVSVCERV